MISFGRGDVPDNVKGPQRLNSKIKNKSAKSRLGQQQGQNWKYSAVLSLLKDQWEGGSKKTGPQCQSTQHRMQNQPSTRGQRLH